MKIGRGVSELWRVENLPLPLTWPMAYTTACTTVQAVIRYSAKRGLQRGLRTPQVLKGVKNFLDSVVHALEFKFLALLLTIKPVSPILP